MLEILSKESGANMNALQFKEVRLCGQTGKLLDNIIDHWLVGLRESNPAILGVFADRDLKPYRKLEPWHGEFPGKYLTGAYYTYKLTGSKKLYDYILPFIDELISYQDEDGYLGCFSKEGHLTGYFNPSLPGGTWDSWNHYHIMFGLLLWYDVTKNETYLQAVERIAALFMEKFYYGKPGIISIGSSEMNLAAYHIFGILYRRTGNEFYLDFAKQIETDLSDETAGNYLYYAENNLEFYECPKPRWESIHIILGFVEMYRNTAEKKYLDAAKQIFYSILKTDVHNTGAFSTDEQAVGNPYQNGAIETCCVIAYNALAIELYLLTGDTKIVDFLERSHYNAVLGYNSPSGKWSTYDTPMDGTRCANYHSINFQSRPGSPNLNCCSVNAPRGVANLSEWMMTEKDDTIYLNFYEDMKVVTEDDVLIEIEGNYPASNKVKIRINSNGKEKNIAFRVPGWSKQTSLKIGEEILRLEKGGYCACCKRWNDTIEVTFDFAPYIEEGDLDCAGKSSIFVGPVLYGLDLHDNPSVDFEQLPVLSKQELMGLSPVMKNDGSIKIAFSNGIVLKDFYHLGETGSQYKTWLKIK